MIFLEKPDQFIPKMEVVGCFLEYNDTILFLHRQDNKPQGNTWNAPGGKIDPGESLASAMRRELFEETGYDVPEAQFVYFKKFYVKYPEFDFIYHVFQHRAETQPIISIHAIEHKDHAWLTPREALKRELIPDEDFCIKLFYKDCLQ